MLPVAVVYEPFPNADGQNSASYATVKGLGSTVKLSFGGSSSTTRPKIGTLTEIKDQAAKLGAQLKQFTSEDPKKVDAKKVARRLRESPQGSTSFSARKPNPRPSPSRPLARRLWRSLISWRTGSAPKRTMADPGLAT